MLQRYTNSRAETIGTRITTETWGACRNFGVFSGCPAVELGIEAIWYRSIRGETFQLCLDYPLPFQHLQKFMCRCEFMYTRERKFGVSIQLPYEPIALFHSSFSLAYTAPNFRQICKNKFGWIPCCLRENLACPCSEWQLWLSWVKCSDIIEIIMLFVL